MGAASAEHLALTRPGARGAVLMHGALPPEWFGHATWPAALPLHIHVAEADPWVDVDVVNTLEHEGATVTRYPGAKHLFADDDDVDFDAKAATQMTEDVRAFLATLA